MPGETAEQHPPDVAGPDEAPGGGGWTADRYKHLASDIGYRYALVLAWILVIVLFSVLRPETFATGANFKTILATQSVLLILAIGLLLPLIVGEFDLSIAPTLGFASILLAVLNVNEGWPIGLAVLAAVAIGPIIGLMNAVLVVKFNVNAFVATLGVGTVVTGVGYAVSNYAVIPSVSPTLVSAISTQVFGIQISFYYAIALAALVWYVFRYTPTGRHMLFVGEGAEVARLSGLPVKRLRMGAFVVCGLISALAGVVLTGTLGAADPTASASYLLPAYAAAFLGSTAVIPGQFNAWGTTIAVYFLVTGITGLQLLGLRDWIQDVFYGISLIFAVTLSQLVSKRRADA